MVDRARSTCTNPKPELDKHHGEPYFNKIARRSRKCLPIPGASNAQSIPVRTTWRMRHVVWMRCRILLNKLTISRIIRSLHTTNITHEPALYIIQSGHMPSGYPTLGSWVVYGLGSECQNLPAYVVFWMIRSVCRSTVSKTGRRDFCRPCFRERGFAPPVRPFSTCDPKPTITRKRHRI